MKRSLALTLTALMLVFSLTACGGGKTNNQETTAPGNETIDDAGAGAGTGNSDNGTSSSETDRNNGANDDTLLDDAGNAAGDLVNGAGDAVGDVVNGVENAVDDVLPGENAKQRSTGGVTYDQMLNNGTQRSR